MQYMILKNGYEPFLIPWILIGFKATLDKNILHALYKH